MKKGADFGWPYCYFDPFQKKKVLAPEYGGDKNKTGRCEDKDQPVYNFPGHWGPNALLFYTGTQFPEKYRNGAFIAWHGSWNRAPREQQGYFVTFLPSTPPILSATSPLRRNELQQFGVHTLVVCRTHAMRQAF